MAQKTAIPFFDTDANDDVSAPDTASSPSSPTSSLRHDVNFLSLFLANTQLIIPFGDEGDELCCELFPGGPRPVLCRVNDPRLLDHVNALAARYSKGDLSCFLGQRDLPWLQDFCRAQKATHAVVRPVHKRLAWVAEDGAIWLDLSRPDGLCVRITRSHWNLEVPLHAMFLHGRTQRPLPEPVSSDDGYAALCRMLPPMSEEDIKLLIGAILGMLIPSNFTESFSYPVLVITGDPGAGKSTLAKLIKALTDKENTSTSTRPTKVQDLWVQAQYSHVLSYDNIRSVWDGLSDGMCALATGAAHNSRVLYTNNGLSSLRGHCAIILNGINPALAQQDLLDRAITITLSRFETFNPDAAGRTEAELPLVLGYFCDLMVKALANYDTTHLDGSVRLSLVAKIAAAAEPFGCATPFVDLLMRNQRSALVATREHDPVIDALYDLMGSTPEWRGNYKELLAALALKADLSTTSSADWPRSAHKLSAFLRTHTRLIRELDIEITPGPRDNNGRIVTVSRLPAFTYSKSMR